MVEFFFVPTIAAGVEILDDWDGFGMRASESQAVRYRGAQASALVGFPELHRDGAPAPSTSSACSPRSPWLRRRPAAPFTHAGARVPALRLQAVECQMRFEAARAYLFETAGEWRPGADAAYAQRVLRMKTFVTRESVRIAPTSSRSAGGRNYRRNGTAARLFADAFAGTALRPPLSLALETLTQQFAEA